MRTTRKLKQLAEKLAFAAQKPVLLLTHSIFKHFVKEDEALWIIGVEETANIINHTKAVFDKAYTVNFVENRFYKSNRYDFCLKAGPLAILARIVVGPILLAYLACRAQNFFYLGRSGFLLHSADGRNFELAFLKKQSKKIVCFFAGSDIRSPALSLQHAQDHEIDVMMTYLIKIVPAYAEPAHEQLIKMTAEAAEQHANYIFTAPVDQISYFTRGDLLPCCYFYPDENFTKNDRKFESIGKIKIVHAPSLPFIKGTQILRAAIKKLQLEGYDFNYVELQEKQNTNVLEELRDAHVVVNELYAFVPGLLGVEAMASHCALITSADSRYETTLPEGANDAWIVTHYWDIYDKLKMVLDNKSLIKQYADKGFDWAAKNHKMSSSKERVRQILGAA